MAINIQYGPIASALGLAQTAGANQSYAAQQQRQLQALQIQAQQQAEIDANNRAKQAQEIQVAMAQQELQAKQAQEQQAGQQQAAYQQAQLQMQQENAKRLDQAQANQVQQNAAEQQTREEQAKSLQAQQAQALADKKAKQQWLGTLSPQDLNTVMSGGHLAGPQEVSPYQQGLLDAKAAELQNKQGNQSIEGLRKDEQSLLRQIGILDKEVLPSDNTIALKTDLNNQLAEKRAQIAAGAPTKTSAIPNPGSSATTQPSAGPTGPSPYGVGGRKKMADGSTWTWNGISWVKG